MLFLPLTTHISDTLQVFNEHILLLCIYIMKDSQNQLGSTTKFWVHSLNHSPIMSCLVCLIVHVAHDMRQEIEQELADWKSQIQYGLIMIEVEHVHWQHSSHEMTPLVP